MVTSNLHRLVTNNWEEALKVIRSLKTKTSTGAYEVSAKLAKIVQEKVEIQIIQPYREFLLTLYNGVNKKQIYFLQLSKHVYRSSV